MKTLYFMILLCVCVNCFGADALPPMNYNPAAVTQATRVITPFVVNNVTAADTELTAKTRYWDALAIGTKFKRIDNTCNYLKYSFYVVGDGNDPNSGTFNFKIYAADWFCSAKVVATGTCAVGDLLLSRDMTTGEKINANGTASAQYKWVSGITSFTDKWSPSGATWCCVTGNTEGDNDIATVTVDMHGAGATWCEITSISAGGHIRRVVCLATGF